MGKGSLYPAEARELTDGPTGARIRQVTSHPAIHHHPFFLVPAYDDAMHWLVFVSHRTGSPQIFAEDRETGKLLQLTDRADLAAWSIHPSHDGRHVYFTAGGGAWRVELSTFDEERLADLGELAEPGTGRVAAAAGATALSPDDRWWAISVKAGEISRLVLIDTHSGSCQVILGRDAIGHPEFCPDDSNLIRYSGPLTDRVWVVNRDGSNNRRLYRRKEGEWITHESWIPGRREVAFVDWPHGVRCVNVDTLAVRQVASFNAWHAVSNRRGRLMVADTNFPDVGVQLFDPLDGVGEPRTLCHPQASSIGRHWAGPFPYEHGPVKVHAPQHTHPHPSFSPDGRKVCFTSDRTGCSQVYEADLPEDALRRAGVSR